MAMMQYKSTPYDNESDPMVRLLSSHSEDIQLLRESVILLIERIRVLEKEKEQKNISL
jgi:hypothetical protein